jgi:oligopeptide/dipeptide ABC transporter ATP-binding protein
MDQTSLMPTGGLVSEPVLDMQGVSVSLPRGGRLVPVLDGLDLTIAAGEMLALVGETGSGKTIAALSIPRLLPEGAVLDGRIFLNNTELTALSEPEMRRQRGPGIGMVFQDPGRALNPSMRVGAQIAEAIRMHQKISAREAWARALARLDEVGIPDPAERANDYPHLFSGGQRQRVTIALALACDPVLLIADECTTGLDPVLARQMLGLLHELRRRRDLAVLFVTHDLSLVRRHADTVQVLYAGQAVERGSVPSVLSNPLHPYTGALLAAAPKLTRRPAAAISGMAPEPEARSGACRFADRCAGAKPVCGSAPPDWSGTLPSPTLKSPTLHSQARCVFAGEVAMPAPQPILPNDAPKPGELLSVAALSVTYVPRFGGAGRYAVRDVSLRVQEGECLAIVGASGSGKTSLGRAVLQMLPYDGQVALWGSLINDKAPRARRAARRRMQVVFQDPASSLNPAMTVGALIEEPLLLAGIDARQRAYRVRALLPQMGLADSLIDRYPASLSGGQAQRVALARALAGEPDLLVLDEPTSGLDVSTQAGLLILLRRLLSTRRIAYLFITHDLAAARFLAHRIAVMQDGEIVELQAAEELVKRPRHPASRALVEAFE